MLLRDGQASPLQIYEQISARGRGIFRHSFRSYSSTYTTSLGGSHGISLEAALVGHHYEKRLNNGIALVLKRRVFIKHNGGALGWVD